MLIESAPAPYFQFRSRYIKFTYSSILWFEMFKVTLPNEFFMIVKKNDSFVVLSKEGKNLGKYKTREEAEKRLKQVEFFKNKR